MILSTKPSDTTHVRGILSSSDSPERYPFTSGRHYAPPKRRSEEDFVDRAGGQRTRSINAASAIGFSLLLTFQPLRGLPVM